MTTIDTKQEIVQSLQTLDVCQSEKVLNFIRTLAMQGRDCPDENKRRAAKESGAGLVHARLWI